MAEAFSKDIKRKVAVSETTYEPDIQESQRKLVRKKGRINVLEDCAWK